MKSTIPFLLLLLLPNMSDAQESPVYKPLPPATISQLNKQREFVKGLVTKELDKRDLYGDSRDFGVLQNIVDKNLIKATAAWELQSLGVVFGDALTKYIDGVDWVEVTDAYGTDPVLRFKATSVQLTPLTMISKRVEDGEVVDIQEMADGLKDFIVNRKQEYK